MKSGKRKPAPRFLRWLTVVCLIAFSASPLIAQSPSGTYKVTVRCGRLSKNADRAFSGSTIYLRKHNLSTGETILIDSAAIKRKKAVFSGPSFALDSKTPQNEAFTAGQYDVCDSEGPIFSFFYSSEDGDSFSITFRHRLSIVRPFYIWETDGTKSVFGKENITYLDYQNYLTFKNMSMSKDSSEALAAEYATDVLYPGGDKVVLKRMQFQAEKDAPGSLTCTLLEMALNGFTSEKSEQLPLIADERLLYTSLTKGEIKSFLDKFKFSKESVRNMAIDYLMENRYLTDPKMRAATALACFRRYSSSIVMGCEGSAVYAAEKYILGNDAVSEKDRAEAAWYVTVNKGTLVGDKAPELNLKDTAGAAHSLKEMMGVFSIIYFYSDDCNYCKEETPRLVSLTDSWQVFPLNIAAVYTGTEKAAWKDYIAKHFSTDNPYVSWLHLADLERESKFPVDYGIVSTPKMFLLDESLRIRGRGILTPTLSQMLKEQASEDAKAYEYLSQIFPSEALAPDAMLDLEARKDAVDKIAQGVQSSEAFSRLMRQAFTYLFFCGYAPNTETAMYLGEKYVTDMPQKWEDTVFAESVASAVRSFKMNAPGSKAENISLYDIGGNPADLIPSDGKVKVLYFYRTGCEICKETLPAMLAAWKEYGKKASFTGVYAGKDTDAFRKFILDKKLEFRQLYAKDNISELEGKYYVEAVPMILVVDSDGTIVSKSVSADNLAQTLEVMLKKQK